MNSNDTYQMTTILGDEFDASLRDRLSKALRGLDAQRIGVDRRAIAGSQELEEYEVMIGGMRLHIVSETYMGLSISGPANLVERVRLMVMQ